MRIAFLLSNATHARMFAPVANSLPEDSFVSFVSLDAFRAEGAEKALSVLTANAQPIRLPSSLRVPYSALGRVRKLRAVMEFRRRFGLWLAGSGFGKGDVLVLGSDFGWLERAAIASARRMGIATILVQDGFIYGNESRGLAASAVQSSLGRFLRYVNIISSGRQGYGWGEVDHICAYGKFAREYFIRGGVSPERVSVTGQPRYSSSIIDTAAMAVDKPQVLFASQPLTEYNLVAEDVYHLKLDQLFKKLSSAGFQVILRPHPMEPISKYQRYCLDGVLLRHTDDLFAELKEVALVITITSTVGLESLLVGRPLAVVEFETLNSALPYLEAQVALPLEPLSMSKATLVQEITHWLAVHESDGQQRRITSFLNAHLAPGRADLRVAEKILLVGKAKSWR